MKYRDILNVLVSTRTPICIMNMSKTRTSMAPKSDIVNTVGDARGCQCNGGSLKGFLSQQFGMAARDIVTANCESAGAPCYRNGDPCPIIHVPVHDHDTSLILSLLMSQDPISFRLVAVFIFVF